FVDIGLDGDAFLYVSDVFENLEDYDHGHGHEQAPAVSQGEVAASSEHIELPGESLSRAHEAPVAESLSEESHGDSEQHEVHTHVEEAEPGAPGVDEVHVEEERQPDSNESAPQNFAPRYNPTQYRPSPSFSPRGASDRSSDRGGDRGGSDRGGDRQNFGRSGGRGRFGRGGGGSRGRGGRSSGGYRQ